MFPYSCYDCNKLKRKKIRTVHNSRYVIFKDDSVVRHTKPYLGGYLLAESADSLTDSKMSKISPR